MAKVTLYRHPAREAWFVPLATDQLRVAAAAPGSRVYQSTIAATCVLEFEDKDLGYVVGRLIGNGLKVVLVPADLTLIREAS
jgi:hypothetical protein